MGSPAAACVLEAAERAGVGAVVRAVVHSLRPPQRHDTTRQRNPSATSSCAAWRSVGRSSGVCATLRRTFDGATQNKAVAMPPSAVGCVRSRRRCARSAQTRPRLGSHKDSLRAPAHPPPPAAGGAARRRALDFITRGSQPMSPPTISPAKHGTSSRYVRGYLGNPAVEPRARRRTEEALWTDGCNAHTQTGCARGVARVWYLHAPGRWEIGAHALV